MSFIRAKEIPPHSGNWYDYEVETIHQNGKVIQRHIQYLGKTGTKHPPLKGGSGVASAPKLKVVCKFCESQNTRKFGVYKGIQNYYCNDCNTKFAGTDALAHGRVSPSYIVGALIVLRVLIASRFVSKR